MHRHQFRTIANNNLFSCQRQPCSVDLIIANTDLALPYLHNSTRCVGKQITINTNINPLHLNHRDRVIGLIEHIQYLHTAEPTRSRQWVSFQPIKIGGPSLKYVEQSIAKTQ